MGKNLRQQRRGKGSPRYSAHSHRYNGKTRYADVQGEGVVVDIVHSPGRRVPAAVVDFNGRKSLMLPAEGVFVGQVIGNSTDVGNITRLKNLSEGTKIFNIELHPGDGGRLCRASGSFATIISKDVNNCTVLMPSREKKVISMDCRASVGIVASSGRTEKPFMKAGTKHHSMKALGKLYPHVQGVSMNACNHPFGGQTRPGKPKTVSRHMPPGKKVGSISPRRTGKRKK
ncbi:MAG: 50S ribosomal protein L2 [Candidatus Aenigmarchaeota archaeon]|nr:50S ribosomal protein L2P [uncultured archaeon]MBS3050640.1 50S ribosomal protein L2 [Candidatus Aenigmarchaeota archaeon]